MGLGYSSFPGHLPPAQPPFAGGPAAPAAAGRPPAPRRLDVSGEYDAPSAAASAAAMAAAMAAPGAASAASQRSAQDGLRPPRCGAAAGGGAAATAQAPLLEALQHACNEQLVLRSERDALLAERRGLYELVQRLQTDNYAQREMIQMLQAAVQELQRELDRRGK